MVVYVYTTDECYRDAVNHSLIGDIENIKNRVEKSQNLIGFKVFRPTNFSRKSLRKSFRLLAFEAEVNGDHVIFLLRIFPRSSSEYKWLLDNYQNNRSEAESRFFKFDQEEVSRIHQELSSVSTVQKLKKPSIPEEEWLYSVFVASNGITADDLLILESRHWVSTMLAYEKRDFLALCHKFLENLNLENLPKSYGNNDVQHIYDETREVGIIYVYRPDLSYLSLISPIFSFSEEIIKLRADEYISVITAIEATETEETKALLRSAARSYPYFMILDRDAWLCIQKDEEANLALSPEEGDLLESVRRMDKVNEGFPLFINGRAGSGKSTMLQYLAADYLDFSMRQNTNLAPLYMTYSSDLLESAKSTVTRLLKSHYSRFLNDSTNHKQVKEDGAAADNENIEKTEIIYKVINRSFVVFHDYLYELLPTQVKRQFLKEDKVTYSRFCRLWEDDFSKRPEARNISVDLAWHVVRSYIKGSRSSLDDELTPEEFCSLPRKGRSVSQTTYEFVYRRVWQSWYQKICDKHNYWDDQDLVAAVLDLGITDNLGFPAIFCDEAQDFTPIELELIIQLSIFSKRELRGEQIKQIPFVFAGDPLQTLNPTGFRWENIQSDFYDKFSNTLASFSKVNPEINYKELIFNYRSNPGIVNFCNLIQLLRIAIIGEKKIKPQESWWIQKPVQTVWCDVEDLKIQDLLRQNPDIVKIVNCDIGEETSFVEREEILSNLETSSEGIYRNILSPGRSKGLEFSRVLLYKFGESIPEGFEKLLDGHIEVFNDSEARLPYEYFLNRLYVAASRAKDQLIILESRDTIRKLWRFATDSSFINEFAVDIENLNTWNKHVAYLIEGNQEAWTGEPIDILQQATEYEIQGINSSDPYLLRQAALSYKGARKGDDAVRCIARALELEGRFEEAGNILRESNKYSQAFNCYWKGRCFSSICKLIIDFTSLAIRPEARASDFIDQSDSVPTQFIDFLFDFISDENRLKQIIQDTTWRHVISELSNRLAKAPPDASADWGKAYIILSALNSNSLNINNLELGRIACRARKYSDSIRLHEAANQTETVEYRISKAETTLFPENITWLSKLKRSRQILNEWDANEKNLNLKQQITRDISVCIAEAALAERRYKVTLKVLAFYPDQYRLNQLLPQVLKSNNIELITTSLRLLLIHLAQERSWSAFLALLQHSKYDNLKVEDLTLLRDCLEQESVKKSLLKTAVLEIGTSESLPNEPPDVQAPISEFLFQKFISKNPYQSVMDADLSINDVGSAIERAGKLTNALQFYESIIRAKVLKPQKLKLFLEQRYIKNLEKYADYLKRTQSNQAEDLALRAQHYRKRLGLTDVNILEYPELNSNKGFNDVVYEKSNELEQVSNEKSVSKSSQNEWNIAFLRCTLSKNRQKVSIEHKDSLDRIVISIPDKKLSGDVDFLMLPNSDDSAPISWQIEEWATTIRLDSSDNGETVCVSHESDLLEIGIDSL